MHRRRHQTIIKINSLFLCLIFIGILPCSAFAKSAHLEDAFSPNQGATALVIKVIGDAQKSVRVAAYSFTSRPIAEALVAAHGRGIDVMVVLDKSQRKSPHALARFLQQQGIPTRINDHYAIMHNKFMIIDGKVLELGSFNYTRAAEEKNAENVLVIHNSRKVIQDYGAQWERLWDEGEEYQP